MLLNLSKTIKRLSQPVKLIRITTDIVNHKPEETETEINIKAVIQPANKEKINKDKLDWSLKYILVHSTDEIVIGDLIVHKNIRYKSFEDADYSDYGYYESIMEQQK